MKKPSKISIVDEPTRSPDDKNKINVMAFLKMLNSRRKTIIILTHDDFIAKSCYKIIELNKIFNNM